MEHDYNWFLYTFISHGLLLKNTEKQKGHKLQDLFLHKMENANFGL